MSNDNEEMTDCCWNYVPDTILLNIFEYLSAKELLDVGLTSRTWNRISYDEMLWKKLLYKDFKIDKSIGIVPNKNSWYREYKRLCYETPTICSEVLVKHCDQVLHVSFSHNGTMFATSSKDGFIIVWKSKFPAEEKYHFDMRQFSWKYTQFSQFNQSDTLLLVSGVHFGTEHSTSGEIAVFSLEDKLELQCRVVNKPYDVFGTWYSDQLLFSGKLSWLAHLVSASGIWLNKASQETSSEHSPIMNQLFRFYNTNASSVRTIMVANCLIPDMDTSTEVVPESSSSNKGNPSYITCHSSSNNETQKFSPKVLDSDISLNHDEMNGAIFYNDDYRQVEKERKTHSCEEVKTEDQNEENDSDISADFPCDFTIDSEIEEDLARQPEKFLIFTTGSKTHTPHQIGIKRIKKVKFPKRLDPGPSLSERIAERKRKKEMARNLLGSANRPEINWLNYKEVADKFDTLDHVIDLNGHIIGMGLSPDHRYLYVNCRSWPQGYVIDNPLVPPPIAQEIDIHVIDLVTFQEVGTMLRSHRAFTPYDECFFIFLDVCDEYVSSGAEDRHGYLWDRHYGVCLAKLPHYDVVNSVAFNPKDSGMLVTCSDDFTIKVWRSKARLNHLIGSKTVEELPRATPVARRMK